MDDGLVRIRDWILSVFCIFEFKCRWMMDWFEFGTGFCKLIRAERKV